MSWKKAGGKKMSKKIDTYRAHNDLVFFCYNLVFFVTGFVIGTVVGLILGVL